MNKRVYAVYAVVVLTLVLVFGRDDQDDRSWNGSRTGRHGWSSGGGHK